MTINTENQAYQHFSGSAVNDIIFARPIHHLILTTSGTVGLSLDGGDNFMTITAGTHQFLYLHAKRIYFNGSGTWSGIGISI